MNSDGPNQSPPPPKTNLFWYFAVLAAPAVLMMVLSMLRLVDGYFGSLLINCIWIGGSMISGIACSLMITRESDWSSPGKVVLGITGAIAFAFVSFVPSCAGCLVGASISKA